MIEIVFQREGPKAASVWLVVEDGREIPMGYKETWTCRGMNWWLQRRIWAVYQTMKNLVQDRPVIIREEKA